MTSVDELFKVLHPIAPSILLIARQKPFLPTGNKRKFEASKDPSEIYKATKVDANGDARKQSATVEEEAGAEDEEAGPELPPDFDPDEEIQDDEEGRFFGGGITKDTRGAIDIVDRLEPNVAAQPEKIDSPWLRRLALNFEKKISKNAELRSKFENEPTKFMESEADLDADIKSLSILSEHPRLYPEFAELGCVGSLVSLLAHENADISIDAIEVIAELTDEDVEAEQEQWDSVVNAMLDADLIELLSSNLARLDEGNEADRSGVYHTLNVLENLTSQQAVAEKIGKDKSLMTWILNRIQKEKSVTQNKQYAAEVLSILIQFPGENRTVLIRMDGVDIILQQLSVYRKRDPEKDSDEEEFFENLFDCLICLVDEEAGKAKFLEAEGVELAQIMLREGKMSKSRALRVLSHALSGKGAAECCQCLVEVGALRTVFGMFMKKPDAQAVEHLVNIFSSLLQFLPGASAPRIRALAKFMEKDYEKIVRLVRVRHDYVGRLAAVDEQIAAEKQALSSEERAVMEDDWTSRRLDSGIFTLQSVDVILAWLVAEDDGAKKKITELLADKDEDLSVIRLGLQKQLSELEDAEDDEQDRHEKHDRKDMLTTLIQFL